MQGCECCSYPGADGESKALISPRADATLESKPPGPGHCQLRPASAHGFQDSLAYPFWPFKHVPFWPLQTFSLKLGGQQPGNLLLTALRQGAEPPRALMKLQALAHHGKGTGALMHSLLLPASKPTGLGSHLQPSDVHCDQEIKTVDHGTTQRGPSHTGSLNLGVQSCGSQHPTLYQGWF